MDILEFAKQLNPRLEEMYKIFSNPSDLVGKVVYSNRSGFSCGIEGGTEMILESISGNNVKFSPTDKSSKLGRNGWGSLLENLHVDIRLSK